MWDMASAPERSTEFAALYTRGNNIDALRLILALSVVLSHSYSLTGHVAEEPVYAFTRHQTTLGTVAVDCFFVLSGFLVAVSFTRARSIGDYAWRRFLRIFPGYWAAMLFSLVAVLAARATGQAGLSAHQLLLRIVDPGSFPCSGCFPSNPLPGPVNGALWTLRYETRCYALVVLLGILGCFSRRRGVLAAITVFSVALFLLTEEHLLTLPVAGNLLTIFTGQLVHWPELFPFFCFGALLSVLARDRLRFSAGWAAMSAIALAILARLGHGFCPALVVLGSYLIVWFSAHPGIRLHRFAARGDFSYGVYVYGFPIQQLMVQARPSLGPLELMALATPCTLFMAYLSWNLVEKRALRLAHRSAAVAVPEARGPAEGRS